MIKFLSMQNYKSGVRVTLICGKRAFENYGKKHKSVMKISHLLSSKPEEVTEAVERLKEENQNLRQKIGQLKQMLLEAKAQMIPDSEKTVFLWEENLEPGDLRHMINAAMKRTENIMILVPGKEGIFNYAAACKEKDSRQISKALALQFFSKGGGTAQMVQGTVKGEKEEIKKTFMRTVEEKEC